MQAMKEIVRLMRQIIVFTYFYHRKRVLGVRIGMVLVPTVRRTIRPDHPYMEQAYILMRVFTHSYWLYDSSKCGRKAT